MSRIAQRASEHDPAQNGEGTYRGNGRGTHGVTAKQDRFALLVAQGKTLSDAYRASYDTENMKPDTVRQCASQLAGVPHVAARITAHAEQLAVEKPYDDASTRKMVRDYLMSVVQDSTAKTSDRTRAAELLGKVGGVSLFQEKREEKPVRPATEGEVEALLSRLAALARKEQTEEKEEQRFGDRTATEDGEG